MSKTPSRVGHWWAHLDRAGRIIWITLGAMGTLGGAWGFVQLFNGTEPVSVGLSETSQADLLRMVAEGILTPEQAERLAIAMTGQAFPDQSVTQFAALPEDSEVRRYAEGVKSLAQSADAQRRIALAQIGDDDTRAEGLAALARFAETTEQWRQVGELAYPWDTALAIQAYEHVVDSDASNVWDTIYLNRLLVRAGRSDDAKSVVGKINLQTLAERDQGVILNELGNIAVMQGALDEARTFFKNGLEIAKALAQSDPSSAQNQRDLSVSYDRLGDVARDQGQLDDARTFYANGLEIAKTLAQSDPSSAQNQRDLSISYDRLGDVAQARGQLNEARTFYADGLEIRKALSQSDPSSAQNQRDLIVSFSKLAAVEPDQALSHWQAAKAVCDAMMVKGQLSPKDAYIPDLIEKNIAALTTD